jgi:hypothetical protein
MSLNKYGFVGIAFYLKAYAVKAFKIKRNEYNRVYMLSGTYEHFFSHLII